MKKFLIILLGLFVCGRVSAAPTVLINEFSVEPTQSIELINNSNDIVDISNWYLDDNGGTTYFTIPANSLLYPNSCLVFNGDFNLNKSSADTVRLFDNTAPPIQIGANLIDSFTYSSSPGTGISYFRAPDKSSTWTIGVSSLGRFNQSEENCIVMPTPTPTSIPTITLTPTITLEPTLTSSVSYDNIYLSEVMVAPESGSKEWVEIYNANDTTVWLNNWYIDDIENAGATPKSFSLTILAKSYATFDLSTSMFNNDGDRVRLLDTQKQLKDSFEYSSSTTGKSIGRLSFDDDSLCIQEPTKGRENGGCLEANSISSIETAKEQASISPKPTPTTSFLASNFLPTRPTSSVPSPTSSVLGSLNIAPVSAHSESNLARPLSFLSFGYSLLTLASVLLKMKFNG